MWKFIVKSPELDESGKGTTYDHRSLRTKAVSSTHWGPPGGPVRFRKKIDTRHMCFTVESGPCPTGARTKTLRRRLFVVKRIEFEMTKTKSRRKANVTFRQFQDVRSGMANRDAGEEEEDVIYKE